MSALLTFRRKKLIFQKTPLYPVSLFTSPLLKHRDHYNPLLYGIDASEDDYKEKPGRNLICTAQLYDIFASTRFINISITVPCRRGDPASKKRIVTK